MKPTINTYTWPGQTHFGFGAVGLVAQEAQARQVNHLFILADPGIIAAGLLEQVTASLRAAGLTYDISSQVAPNPDTVTVDATAAAFRESRAGLIVAVGGGSALDAAKAVRLLAGGPPKAGIAAYSLRLGEAALPVPQPGHMPPMIAIPTTAGTGSEVTPWGVITNPADHRKFGVGGPALMPSTALVDPELTLTLPPDLTAATGLDALSHLVEAYVSTYAQPMLDPLILHGITLLGRSLRVAVAQGSHAQARSEVMLGSLIGGIAISSNYLGACHSLAHPLSGLADVPHGVANAIMLPYQMAYSLPGALERYAHIAAALDAPQPVTGTIRCRAERAVEAVRELVADTGLPGRLSEAGVTQNKIEPLAQMAIEDLNWTANPRGVSRDIMEQLYRQAF
jgi:alcohol dehydrogenase